MLGIAKKGAFKEYFYILKGRHCFGCFWRMFWHKGYAFLKQNFIPSDKNQIQLTEEKVEIVLKQICISLEVRCTPLLARTASWDFKCSEIPHDGVGLALIGRTLEVNVWRSFATSIIQEEKKPSMCNYWNWFLEVLRISHKVLQLFSVKTANGNMTKDINRI